MFSPLRTRFGVPGVISVIALVFAMLGGAYAASDSSGGGKATASAKAKKGPKGPKGATGPAGPAGAQGPAGPAGAKGENGANGSNGSNGATGAAGAAGQSVNATDEPAFGECGDQEGVKLTSVSGTNYVCDGAEGPQGAQGEPWVVGQAPTDAILKGTWSIQQYTATAAEEEIMVPISTGVPIKISAATYPYVIVPPGGDPEAPLGCTGTAANPTATVAQRVCIYTQEATNVKPFDEEEEIFSAKLAFSGAGIIAPFKAESPGVVSAYGTWAIKAP